MGTRACYYKGVRLWEVFQDWYPWAARTGEGSHDGITQDWVYGIRRFPRSSGSISMMRIGR